jgi:hypothetical protein
MSEGKAAQNSTRGGTKVMPPFFSENVIAITIKFTQMIHGPFATIRPFSH